MAYAAIGLSSQRGNWIDRNLELLIFAIGLVYELHGKAQPFGEKVQTQIDACQDLIELYRDEGDWKTAHGDYDAVNFSLACLGRVYRREVAAEAPVPTCPSCGSENVKGTLRAGKATVICLDCGHREEGGTCLMTITRMDPDFTAEKIEYQGQIAPLV